MDVFRKLAYNGHAVLLNNSFRPWQQGQNADYASIWIVSAIAGGDSPLRFEKIHEETYRGLGFDLVSVEPGSLAERVSIIKAAIC